MVKFLTKKGFNINFQMREQIYSLINVSILIKASSQFEFN